MALPAVCDRPGGAPSSFVGRERNYRTSDPGRTDNLAVMPYVQTVSGQLSPEALGFVLPHEHTGISLWQIQNRWDYWELTPDDTIVLEELRAYRAAGGGTLVDLTLPGVGRDPERLHRYAEATGLAIVMGTGWYRTAYYPPEARIDRRSVDDLADEMVLEAIEGVAATGIRPGIIGEIGTDKPWLTAQEERVHRAVARAARRTGLAISTHSVMSPVGLDQLRVFEEEGADPARVVIGHADSYPVLEHYLEIVRRGASLEFDFLGMSFTPMERHGEARIVGLLRALVDRGHAGQILLSQDVCHNSQLKTYGGNGYVYLLETFLPRLREAGLPESAIRTMTRDNPARILTVTSPA
jgi:predicted metal-dependent phosphotriesterase family hydrolase